MKLHLFITILFATSVGTAKPKLKREEDLLKIENGTVAVGIDKKKGASITYLSWKGYPKNTVNSADPGRLIQQSYYAGKAFDRTADGQHKAWSPWTWNPIQGGGVGAWAEVTKFKIEGENVLFGETIPKLWDMDNEAAAAVMRQWTSFEKDMSNVIVVRNEFVAKREENDRWGSGVARHQELPAFYFTRNFSQFESYIGGGKWRDESQAPGPPWGRTKPPLNVMACFNSGGQGIAMFSPCATESWNFGPVGKSNSSDPAASDCVHAAPIATVKLGPKSKLSYRYWMVVGTREEIEMRLAVLLKKYSTERLTLENP
ncbi:hypothetical protein OAE61_01200 [Verrucomicrobiales bacterium]|nr:hypothetical protein [Verrucomicrobiales bacterium]